MVPRRFVPAARRRCSAPESRLRGAEQGFTFLGLMFIIALMGLLAAAASVTWRFVSQRDREAQLLFAGLAYRDAITRYEQAHSGQPQPYPTALSQLLQDPQHLETVRYLRRLYFDPITGSDDWGLVRSPQGGITGVYSRSTERPIRTTSDKGVPEDFADAKTYQDWVFTPIKRTPHAPSSASAPPPDDDEDRGVKPQPLPPAVPVPGE